MYVEIGEVLEDKSEAAVDSQDIGDKYSEEQENLKNIFATKSSLTHSNTNQVYGRIVTNRPPQVDCVPPRLLKHQLCLQTNYTKNHECLFLLTS